MPRPRPKVFLSDDPVLPDDVLPPIPKRPPPGADPDDTPEPGEQPGEQPGEFEPGEFEPDELDPADEPNIDGDDENEENTRPPAAHAGEPAGLPPMTGREYSAPVGYDPSIPPTVITYRSRISVVEAWRYPGQLAQAPDFIDRGWTAWAESTIDGKSAGPALRIPVTRSISGPVPADGTKLARIGDYVVRQMVTLVDGLEPEEHLDVWQKDDFERLFMPVNKGKPLANAA